MTTATVQASRPPDTAPRHPQTPAQARQNGVIASILVAAFGTLVPPEQLGRLIVTVRDQLRPHLRRPIDRPADTAARLHITARQLDVLRDLASGLSIEATAQRLWLGVDTVKTHRRKLLANLGALNSPHAVAIAYQLGLLRPGQPLITTAAVVEGSPR